MGPIVDALRVEGDRTARGNWSFRCHMQDFEFLWPVEGMVSATHAANLVQFWRFYPNSHLLALRHDVALTKLRSACGRAYERLMASDEFRRIAPSVGDPNLDDHKYFAEYVINGLRDLPFNYSYCEMWKSRGGDFLALRDAPVLSEHFQKIARIGAALRRHIVALEKRLADLQQKLADRHGLPPVDPSLSAAV